jgi:tRNA threonylcarbamoyladenosine biosynthesis protein TsaE
LSILGTRSVQWADETACTATAQAMAQQPALREAFIELHGTLGSGKTTFVRHLLQALGVQGRIKSPTYAVMESYEVPGLPIWHFDFYRFKDPQEFEDAGFRDVFASNGLKLAEWPEQAAGLLPVPDLRMELLLLDGDQRRVTFEACTHRGLELLPDAEPQRPREPGAKLEGHAS